MSLRMEKDVPQRRPVAVGILECVPAGALTCSLESRG